MNTDTYWREIFRYLGYKNGARPEGGTLRMIERAEADIRAAAEPKHAKRYFALSFLDKGAVEIDGIRIESAALRRNLEGCEGAWLFAATLGAGVDRLISRLTALGRMSEALAAQAAAAMAAIMPAAPPPTTISSSAIVQSCTFS